MIAIDNSVRYYLFVGAQLNGFKYSELLDSSIWTIDGTQTGTINPRQSGPGSNVNEKVLHIF